MKNDELYKQAMKSISDLFSDQSVSPEETITNLNAIIDEIEIMIESIKIGWKDWINDDSKGID